MSDVEKGKPGNPHWQKGQSGNPGGRPKECAEVKALARQHCVEAIEKLVELMRTSKDHRIVKGAADSILDRGIGKPAQIVIGDEDEAPIRIEGRIVLKKPEVTE
jgi:hypothetical protein